MRLSVLSGFLIIMGVGVIAIWMAVAVPFPLNAGVICLMFGLLLSILGEARNERTD